MGKITYTFDTNDPDDTSSIAVHEMAWGMWQALWNYDQALRDILKHQSNSYTEEEIDLAEKLRQSLHNIMFECGVNLDKVD